MNNNLNEHITGTGSDAPVGVIDKETQPIHINMTDSILSPLTIKPDDIIVLSLKIKVPGEVKRHIEDIFHERLGIQNKVLVLDEGATIQIQSKENEDESRLRTNITYCEKF